MGACRPVLLYWRKWHSPWVRRIGVLLQNDLVDLQQELSSTTIHDKKEAIYNYKYAVQFSNIKLKPKLTFHETR